MVVVDHRTHALGYRTGSTAESAGDAALGVATTGVKGGLCDLSHLQSNSLFRTAAETVAVTHGGFCRALTLLLGRMEYWPLSPDIAKSLDAVSVSVSLKVLCVARDTRTCHPKQRRGHQRLFSSQQADPSQVKTWLHTAQSQSIRGTPSSRQGPGPRDLSMDCPSLTLVSWGD